MNPTVAIPSDVFDLVYKEFEAIALNKNIRDDERRFLTRRTWDRVREGHGRQPYYGKLYRKVSYWIGLLLDEANIQVMRHIRLLGYKPVMGSDGTITAVLKKQFSPTKLGGALYSESEKNEDNDFIETIPYAIIGFFTQEEDLMLRLVDVDLRLRSYFMNKKGKTKSHDGVSLGTPLFPVVPTPGMVGVVRTMPTKI